MRHLLAILALVGLLLSPAAASAAAMRCMHEHGGMAMAMVMDASTMSADATGAAHDCCDEDGKSSDHDSSACAQDCAVMCGVSVTLPDARAVGIVGVDAAKVVPQAASGIHPFAPPGLKRPPRTIA